MTNLMPTSMASWNLLALFFLLPLPTTLCLRIAASNIHEQSASMYPLTCSDQIKTCNSILYQSNGLQKEQIATYYSVNVSDIKLITQANKHDYLVPVPCSCKNVSGTVGYFYDTVYDVKPKDTFVNVSAQIYSGQAWPVGGEERLYVPEKQVPVHLLCGCVQNDAEVVVTYTVQQQDTLSNIGSMLSAQVSKIQSLNKILTRDPTYIDVGWVLFVPMEKNGTPAPKKGKDYKWTIIIGILAAATLFSMCTLAIIILRQSRSQQDIGEDPKAVSKSLSAHKSFSLQNQYLQKEGPEGQICLIQVP